MSQSLPPFTRKLLNLGLSDALPTVATRGNISCLLFNVMKLLPAWASIEGARRRGQLKPGGAVIESSSGSFAYGLARVCLAADHPLTIITAELEPWLAQALRQMRASVELVDVGAEPERVQQLRLERLHELQQANAAYWTRQYDNPDNPCGYTPAAELLVRTSGIPDFLVCPVGSGGNSAGLITALRAVRPETQLVGVDAFGSVTFGLPLGPRSLGGIGNSLLPRCVRHETFDEVHWVSADVAVAGAKRIVDDGLGDYGLTAGCTYWVACWLARQHPSARIAAVFPDRAHRYVEQIALGHADVPEAPLQILHPRQANPPWARLAWQRRPLKIWRAAESPLPMHRA